MTTVWSHGVAPAATPQVRRSDIGFDANGFTALSLLAPADDGEIVALISSPRDVVLMTRSADRAAIARVTIAADALPFTNHSLDAVIVDLERFDLHRTAVAHLAQEIARVLRPTGQCVAAVSHRRRPRRLRAIGRYRLVPASRGWRHACAGAGLVQRDAAVLRFDGARLTEIVPSDGAGEAGDPHGGGDAAALIFAPKTPTHRTGASLLQAMVSQLRSGLGDSSVRVERVLVRKIGKTACIASSRNRGRVVVKIPRSEIALRRARNNFAALEVLHDSRSPLAQFSHLAPVPAFAGSAGHNAFFAETLLEGRPRLSSAHTIDWEGDALSFIETFHRATRVSRRMDDALFAERIAPPLEAIAAGLQDESLHVTLTRLAGRLHGDLTGSDVPFVAAHGDLTNENCLYDGTGRLTAVIDWELFSPEALPLLDLLQCMDVPGEAAARHTWLRGHLVLDAVEGQGPLHRCRVLDRYLDVLGVPDRIVPALLLMYWVDQVAPRIAARSDDGTWLEKRVYAPLRRMARLL